MQFGNLNILVFLWLIPGLGLFYFFSFRRKDLLLRTFCADGSLLQRLLHGVSRGRQVAKAVLIVAAIGLALVALARPRWGFRWEEVKRKGVEIVVALDVSQSMMARDVDPNRLERAKREVTDLVRMLQGDKVGLVAFAGSSFIECPLTLDYGAFSLFLDALSPDLIPVPGTALAGALRTSLSAFDKSANTSRAVIMITDGEDHEGDAVKAAEEAKEQGVKIFTIGIGSREGAPVPLQDGSGGFKKDSHGGLVLSKLDEGILEQIALTTGGKFVHSVTGDMDLKTIYLQGIRKEMEGREFASTRIKKWKERFQWPLFAAVLCLIAEAMLRETRREETR
jgi:Ca-activated chloride channel family protein